MGVNIPKINYPESNPALFLGTMYYNYKYDQLNRITGMDAYTKYLAAAQAWPSYIVSLDDYRERVSYDANGNILKYLRHGTTLNSRPLNMDSLSYKYYAGTNQLRQVRDSVNAANYTEDIDDQSDTSNYVYDAIGNLTKDKAEGIDSIKWNVYGKIMSIHKSSGLNIWYTYDAGGNRVSKKVKNGSDSTYTWYARDASGNVLSVYRIKNDTAYQDELHLYGSSRIGMIRPERNLILAKQYGDTSGTLTLVGAWKGNVYRRGQKFFELANHLGNVLVTITDKKLGFDGNTDGTVDYYMPDVATANDYYPFGMGMPERKFSLTDVYRYGFNGKENDNEVKGEGSQQDYGMRIYDPRVGKFLSVDPLMQDYPWNSPYAFAENDVIRCIDLDGAEKEVRTITSQTQGNGNTLITLIDNMYHGDYIGYKPTTIMERIAMGFVQSNYKKDRIIPIDGTFTFHYNLDNRSEDWAEYTWVENEQVRKLQFNAADLQYMNDLYDETVDKFNKKMNIIGSLVNLGVTGALVRSTLKAASAELKAGTGGTIAETKETIRIRLANSNEVNKQFSEMGWKAPYNANVTLGELTTPKNLDLVRLSGANNIEGLWYTTANEVKGLSAQQLKDKFSLKFLPTNITPVTLQAGAKIRVGTAAEIKEFGTKGGGFQIEKLNGNATYGTTQKIK